MTVLPRGLELAYGDDEPEYTLDMITDVNPDSDDPEYTLAMIRAINPDYKVIEDDLRLPARGLELAYGDDDPEYTLDMITEEQS